MSGETDLDQLLQNMQPELKEGEYVFVCLNKEKFKSKKLNPRCIFMEDEGISVIIRRDEADKKYIQYKSIFKMITLKIHSSLDAVGFLAKITNELAKQKISVNPISTYYHDHFFVPASRAEEAMTILKQITE